MAFVLSSFDKNDEEKSVIKKKTLKSYSLCLNKGEWWKNAVIYEVYVRSFYDSDGDGIGDLNGIRSKLDYFKDLGINTLWLTPFYPSPMVDFGYDISNFIDVDPVFGNLHDFQNLLRDMKDKHLKLILDFVPNHTSDQHEWFVKSIKKEDPYTDYYVWKPVLERDDAGKPIPPNNWVSVFGGSGWTYHPSRKEFYFHQFAKEQPDLNFRNNEVITEMKKVLEFWLELGVDGFRLDAAPHLLEDPLFRDNPQSPNINKSSSKEINKDNYEFWSHEYTTDVPGNLDVIAKFRQVIDTWTSKTGNQRILLTEGYLDIKSLMNYYRVDGTEIAHFSFNFELLNINSQTSGLDVLNMVSNWFDNLPPNCCSNWLIGNHDQPRVGNRCGEDAIDLLNFINLLLPGTAVTYYGEEIGMMNTEIKWEETVDPAGKNQGPEKYHLYSRDPERTPMQFSSGNNAGFTSGLTTWLPINPNYKDVNVQKQLEAEESHLKVYKSLVNARKSNAWKYGALELGCLSSPHVFGFTRIDEKSKSGLLVVINFGHENLISNATCFKNVPSQITLLLNSLNISTSPGNAYFSGLNVDSKNIQLAGRTGLVFTFIL